jgi:hypothetical protein
LHFTHCFSFSMQQADRHVHDSSSSLPLLYL